MSRSMSTSYPLSYLEFPLYQMEVGASATSELSMPLKGELPMLLSDPSNGDQETHSEDRICPHRSNN